DAVVVGVGNEDVPAPVHRDAKGVAEFPVPGAIASPLGHEGARKCAAHARAVVPVRGLTADLPAGAADLLGARPPTRWRLGNGARVIGDNAAAVVLARRLTADLTAGACPAARGCLRNIACTVGSDAPTGTAASALTADLPAGALAATRWCLRSEARGNWAHAAGAQKQSYGHARAVTSDIAAA